MNIGLMGAMQEEIRLLLKDMHGAHHETRAMRDYWRGTLYGKDTTLVFSRWGKVAAASTVTTLLEVFGVDVVVFTGVAGAVSGDLAVGDVVIGSELIQYDLDASAIPGLRRFEVPLLDDIKFSADRRLVELAMRSASRYMADELDADVPRPLLAEFGIRTPKVRGGLIISGDQFIANAAVLDRLRRAVVSMNLSEPQCVEMEGAAVAQVCYEHKAPFIVVRTISDRADRSAPVDFPRFVAEVAGHFTRGIVKQLIAEI